MINPSNQKGFSLIELLVVVVVIGIVAAMAIPSYQRGIRAAENGTTFGTMRAISSTQVMFFSQNSRFGRLTELQNLLGNSIGVTTGDKVFRGRYVFEMSPTVPTDSDLSTEYVITATRSVPNEEVFKYELTQEGKVRQILPLGSNVE